MGIEYSDLNVVAWRFSVLTLGQKRIREDSEARRFAALFP